MQRLLKAVVFGAALAAGFALAGTLVCVFLQVIFRYVLSLPLSWSEELARILFAWSSMLGAAAGARSILDQGFDVLTRKLSAGLQKPVDIAARSATMIVSVVIVLKGFELTAHVHEQVSSSIGIRMSWVYAAVPVGALFLLVILALDTYVTYAARGGRFSAKEILE